MATRCYLKISDAAEVLDTTPGMIHYYTRTEKLKPTKKEGQGNALVFTPHVLEDFIRHKMKLTEKERIKLLKNLENHKSSAVAA